MVKFKLICPQCGATAVTATPNTVIWERCPGCRIHTWDEYDVLMAELWENPGDARHAALPHGN